MEFPLARAGRTGARTVATWLRQLPWWVSVALVAATFALVAWQTLLAIGPRAGYDSAAFEEYAELYDALGRLPTEEENYEYWLPPGLPVAAVYVKRATEALPLPPAPFGFVPQVVRQVAWLALVVIGLVLLADPRRRRWGVVGCAVAALWAASHVLWSVKTIPWHVYPEVSWFGYPVLSLFASTGLVVASGLVAKEVWPESRVAPMLVAAATALFPIVLRIGLFFHPDPWLALLVALALWLLLRASRRDWSPWAGFGAGSLMGTAALVRPSAALVMGCLGLGALAAGRRRSLPFLAVAAVAIVAIAGPWWIAQTIRTGNPLKANLERPGYMLDRQPLSFYVSFPFRDLVLHPYRPRFENELLPRFHAELWADWGRNTFRLGEPTTLQRISASTQSVLGLGGDALVLGGLALAGIPALRRARRGRATATDTAPIVLTVLFVLTWIAFVATLIRYPQAEGDPIKSNYVLFVTPACAVMAVWSARRLWRAGRLARTLLVGWTFLYLLSYALVTGGAG